MIGRLQGKTAIITGSSSGIGRAIALLYARHGANIILSDLRPSPRNIKPESTSLSTAQELSALSAPHIFQKCDTTSSEDVEALVARAVEKFGRVDVMVNNAGVAQDDERVWEMEESTWDQVVGVNLKGVFLGTKWAARQMRGQVPLEGSGGDRGWIVNLSSILGLGGQAGSAAYTASKHGVMGLTKSAAIECAPDQIHVNAICPGYTKTSMTKLALDKEANASWLLRRHPFRGFGEAEDIARAALFLASEDAGWVTGVGLPVDGGYDAF